MGARAFEDVQSQLGASKTELVDLLGVGPADVVCIFLGGSIAEGLGNPRSDVDVYLIVESLAPFKAAEERFKSLQLGDRIVAPAFFSTDAVMDAYRRAGAGGVLSTAEIDLLHRIGAGIALVNEQAYEHLRAQLPREALARLLVRSGEAMLANIFADVIGTLEANDLPTCAFNARSLIDCAMDAYLAMRGDTLAREKWRYRKIERTLGLQDSVAHRYLELASAVRFGEAEVTFDYVEKCLELYQRIETRLVAYALDPSFPAILSSGKSESAAPGVGQPRRNPLIKMAHEPDGTLILIERSPLFRLSAPYSLIWLTIDGARRQGEAARVATEMARATGRESAGLEKTYASCLAEWSSAGLLVAS